MYEPKCFSRITDRQSCLRKTNSFIEAGRASEINSYIEAGRACETNSYIEAGHAFERTKSYVVRGMLRKLAIDGVGLELFENVNIRPDRAVERS